MSKSEVLYRKYRPKAWGDVLGQEHIVSVLEASVKLGRVSHAYLFSGSRGTGKTTLARIFSKSLKVSENDIYEIDAASKRGIDDIREIRDGVHILPFESPYKVYIIDEVHMLTKEAFNALLKTLEEPPAHVIFILATTEMEKIPETVVSRCQIFTFKKPSAVVLKELLSVVAKKEGFSLEAGVADLVALLSEGSFRDALGTLQKVFSFSNDKKILLSEVERVTGAPRAGLVNDFVKAVALQDRATALTLIGKVCEQNVSIRVFLALVLEKLRAVLLIRNAPSGDFTKDFSGEDSKILAAIASDPKSKVTSSALLELLKAYELCARSYIESLPLELAVVTICGGGQ